VTAPLTIAFEGFVQIRLATDPDPSDDPRGASGWTFAVAGEPDLDRVLVLQEDDQRRVHRSFGPTIGVSIRDVQGASNPKAREALLGARVDLLDGPRFEGRNWVIATDGNEPIDPFHLSVGRAGMRLTKFDELLDSQGNVTPIYRVEPDVLSRRQAVGQANPKEVLQAIGVKDPKAWRQARLAQLKDALAKATDATTRAALAKRIGDFDIPSPATPLAAYGMQFDFPIQGPGTIEGAVLEAEQLNANADWPIRFWVGGWDADALCAYLRGTLTIPRKKATPRTTGRRTQSTVRRTRTARRGRGR